MQPGTNSSLIRADASDGFSLPHQRQRLTITFGCEHGPAFRGLHQAERVSFTQMIICDVA
jgi:hypothetical protein